jgi:thiamine biosynthesis lipoprotein
MVDTAIPAYESFRRFKFRAMNTSIEITYCSSEKEASRIEWLALNWFQTAEERFSRFKAESELSHLNRLAGELCMVSDKMLEVLLLAEMYRKKTDGIFDPLLLNALMQAGYDKTFEQLKDPNDSGTNGLRCLQVPLQGLAINEAMKSILMPDQTQLDLGGIVKSWAVQRLADYFQEKLELKRGVINAGGDLTVWGDASDPVQAWSIAIEKPWQENEEIGFLALSVGSVATSSKLGRQWETKAGKMHHIIDPRTMSPSNNEVIQCTVSGGNVIDCEIWAKVICILGCKDGLSMLARKTDAYEALVFTSAQETHFYGKQASLGKKWLNASIDYYHYAAADDLQSIGGA